MVDCFLDKGVGFRNQISRTDWRPTQWLLRKKLLTGFFSRVSWAEIGTGLSGPAGVLAYFFPAYYLLGTTLCLVVHPVGLPLLFIGFCSFLCHADSLPQAGPDS
jgi:hypothetical protein